ncbi:MAG: AAA-like domain-containing protein [Verrucomicrobia bacterium]|nr:AAA-like domain-containing protein [Verrucomicrobiota bacterium]
MSENLIHHAAPGLRIAILHKRYMPLDEELAHVLETQLAAAGFQVFTDKHLSVGVEWAKEIERQLRSADAVIPLLSHSSSQSEMIAYEVELVHEAAQINNGRPHLFPIRVNYDGPLPELLGQMIDSLAALMWNNSEDSPRVITELVAKLRAIAPAQPAEPAPKPTPVRLAERVSARPKPAVRVVTPAPNIPSALEPIGGAVPLHSAYYLVRPQDADLQTAVARYDSIILIKGARQMGKTSMLARGLQSARERGAKVVLTDFQKLNVSQLESPESLYFTLAESLAEQLQLSTYPQDTWDERRGPNVNFERYLRKAVLASLNAPLVWGMDEVDRLFTCQFGSEVFGLFRSWHNERSLDPTGPWAGLTLIIAYATEAHLFITDMNQSPFNIGTRLTLEDFKPEQVAELNRRHKSPLKNAGELASYIRLVGGQPYLVRRGLYEMVTQKMELPALEQQADRDEGIYGDHLRRLLVSLAKDNDLCNVMRGVLLGDPCPTPESFYRLRTAGLIIGETARDAKPRCELYAIYLKRHLL